MPKRLELWFVELIEHYNGFRRAIVVYVAWLVAYLTIESIAIITLAITYKASLIDLAATFTALYAPLGLMMAFVTKLYFDVRTGQ